MILKPGIELHEFDAQWMSGGIGSDKQYKILYSGKPSEVTEEMAREWVEVDKLDSKFYKEYNTTSELVMFPNRNTKDSFKSACTKSWIIITKKKI